MHCSSSGKTVLFELDGFSVQDTMPTLGKHVRLKVCWVRSENTLKEYYAELSVISWAFSQSLANFEQTYLEVAYINEFAELMGFFPSEQLGFCTQ